MSKSAERLSPRAMELLSATDSERLEHIDKPVFITYGRASDILAEMEELLVHPKTNRMPNILIVGQSDNGKTEILKEFLKRHPAEDRRELDSIYAPVIYIQSPPGPNEDLFLDKMLMMLGETVKANDTPRRKLIHLIEILERIQTRVLLVDELNALLAGSVTKQRFFLNMLKYISNESKISIVAAGTVEAEYAVNSDPQLKSRFPLRPLPIWKEDKVFRDLLYNFEYVLPLKQSSEIYKGEIASMLYGLSEGVIGEVAKILRSAAKLAITTKVERITLDVIAKCPYVVRNKSGDDKSI
ncbi:MAG: TniB family NTP-binding protein [Gallionella sp.]|nr:TniB family NTP-binding protein [Gallionella sp.]